MYVRDWSCFDWYRGRTDFPNACQYYYYLPEARQNMIFLYHYIQHAVHQLHPNIVLELQVGGEHSALKNHGYLLSARKLTLWLSGEERRKADCEPRSLLYQGFEKKWKRNLGIEMERIKRRERWRTSKARGNLDVRVIGSATRSKDEELKGKRGLWKVARIWATQQLSLIHIWRCRRRG